MQLNCIQYAGAYCLGSRRPLVAACCGRPGNCMKDTVVNGLWGALLEDNEADAAAYTQAADTEKTKKRAQHVRAVVPEPDQLLLRFKAWVERSVHTFMLQQLAHEQLAQQLLLPALYVLSCFPYPYYWPDLTSMPLQLNVLSSC